MNNIEIILCLDLMRLIRFHHRVSKSVKTLMLDNKEFPLIMSQTIPIKTFMIISIKIEACINKILLLTLKMDTINNIQTKLLYKVVNIDKNMIK